MCLDIVCSLALRVSLVQATKIRLQLLDPIAVSTRYKLAGQCVVRTSNLLLKKCVASLDEAVVKRMNS